MVPKDLNISTTVQEEEIAEPLPTTSSNHVTLRDVSAIEQETEPEHRFEQADLSMSLLPFMPTTYPPIEEEEEDGSHQSQQQQNKSIASTISDKTFVKTSLKGFSSDEDETDGDDEDDDETIVEDSLVGDAQENARPLLLTADRSIRRPTTISVRGQTPSSERNIKRENVTFREPLIVESTSPRKTFLLNTNTFDATISNSIRPTIVENEEPTPSSTTVFTEP